MRGDIYNYWASQPHNNISACLENQFLAKVTALSAVSEQGELQFWLLCISTSITIFLSGWPGQIYS